MTPRAGVIFFFILFSLYCIMKIRKARNCILMKPENKTEKKEAAVAIGKTYPVAITGLTAEGKGVGKICGMAVFVAGALPGEQVEAHITGKKKRYAWGEMVSLKNPSPQRVTPPCPYAGQCGGCSLSHLDYTGQLAAKEETITSQIQRIGGAAEVIPLPIIGANETFGYRNRVYLHYRDGKLGFFAAETREIIPVCHCLLASPAINEIIAALQRHEAALKEIAGLRHILIKESNLTHRCAVAFLCQGEKQGDMKEKTAFLQQEQASLPLAGVWYNYGKKAPWSDYFSLQWQHLWGEETLAVSLMEKNFQWGINAFLQVNFAQTEKLYGVVKAMMEKIPTPIQTIWDIYCGIGAIGICLGGENQHVIGIESVAEAIVSARENARRNGVQADYLAGLCEDVLPRLVGEGKYDVAASVAVLDPPRSGCDPQVLAACARAGFPYLIYVSCHGASLARDMKILAEKGYAPVEIQPVDLFPQTGHVECVVLLSKVQN